MSDRKAQHITGESAEIAVAGIWTATGAAVDFIHRDYGEDLLVQTALNGSMDPSRVWVQVKGRSSVARLRLSSGGLSLQVKVSHALRWVRSADLAVVILWDIAAGRGWWTIPRDQISEYDLIMSGHQTTSLHFKSSAVFDARAATELAWWARMHHTWRILASDAGRQVSASLEPGGAVSEGRDLAVVVALWELLREVDIFAPDGVPDYFRQRVKNAMTNVAKDGVPPEECLGVASMLAVMAEFEDRGAPGIPGLVLRGLTDAVANVLVADYDFEAPKQGDPEV